jgi:hypothetical protein
MLVLLMKMLTSLFCFYKHYLFIYRLHNYGELFVELNETLMPTIVAEPGLGLGDMTPLDLLLIIVGHHDYSVCVCVCMCI